MKINYRFVLAFAIVALPFVAIAQQGSYGGTAAKPAGGVGVNVHSIGDVFLLLSALMNMLIGLAVTAGVLAFMWGMVQYLWSVGEQKQAGLHTMLWGALAIFFMVSIIIL